MVFFPGQRKKPVQNLFFPVFFQGVFSRFLPWFFPPPGKSRQTLVITFVIILYLKILAKNYIATTLVLCTSTLHSLNMQLDVDIEPTLRFAHNDISKQKDSPEVFSIG